MAAIRASLERSPEKAAGAPEANSGVTPRPAPKSRLCPECGEPYAQRAPNQLFCSRAHGRAWDNRATVRGAKLFPLVMVARITRNGTRGTPAERETGRRASGEANLLIQRWTEEDREAGRTPWPIYLGRAYAVGRDPLT